MSVGKLTVYKLNEQVTSFDDFIAEIDAKKRKLPDLLPLEIKDVPDGLQVEAGFAFKLHESEKTHENVPWIKFINAGAADRAISFRSENKFPCAIVALKITDLVQSEFYALTFGLGAETFLDSDKTIKDFGLRIAMNICDIDNLKRIQTNIHESVSTHTEKQISTGSNLTVFQINDEKEFLKSVAGSATNEYNFIKSFVGKDSISIKVNNQDEIEWGGLIKNLKQLGEAYKKETYKENFSGYSKFHYEKNPAIIDELDNLLFEKIRNGQTENIHLAPPEFIDFETRSFSYSRDAEKYIDDLSIEDFLKSRRTFRKKSSVKSLKSARIYVWSSETNAIINAWSAYKCVVAEIELQNETYILSIGQWKKVSTDFKKEVNDYIKKIQCDQKRYLPNGILIWDAVAEENREEVFNAHIAKNTNEVFSFDKAKLEVAGEKKYEICDLLHLDKTLIHVKRLRQGAASISHLFLQGKFYSDAFVSDLKCRKSMRKYVTDNAEGKNIAEFLNLIPLERSNIITNDYRVLFCILTDKNNLQMNNLPFMAKYEMMHSHKHINEGLGFKCEYKIVNVLLGKS